MDSREAGASKLHSARQVGALVGVSPETIMTWARRGWIPSVRPSPKVVRFEWAAVLAALRDRGAVRGVGGCS